MTRPLLTRLFGQPLPKQAVECLHLYESPMFPSAGKDPDPEALARCLALVKCNVGWKLSTQNHKWWGVR